MVEGISLLGYQKVPDMGKPSMSLVAAADYLVYVKPEYAEEQQAGDGMASIFGDSKIEIPSTMAWFRRWISSWPKSAEFTLMSKYSPSLVSPTPNGAAKDII